MAFYRLWAMQGSFIYFQRLTFSSQYTGQVGIYGSGLGFKVESLPLLEHCHHELRSLCLLKSQVLQNLKPSTSPLRPQCLSSLRRGPLFSVCTLQGETYSSQKPRFHHTLKNRICYGSFISEAPKPLKDYTRIILSLDGVFVRD